MFNIIFGILLILLLIFDYFVIFSDFQNEIFNKIATSLTFFVFFILSISLALKIIL